MTPVEIGFCVGSTEATACGTIETWGTYDTCGAFTTTGVEITWEFTKGTEVLTNEVAVWGNGSAGDPFFLSIFLIFF